MEWYSDPYSTKSAIIVHPPSKQTFTGPCGDLHGPSQTSSFVVSPPPPSHPQPSIQPLLSSLQPSVQRTSQSPGPVGGGGVAGSSGPVGGVGPVGPVGPVGGVGPTDTLPSSPSLATELQRLAGDKQATALRETIYEKMPLSIIFRHGLQLDSDIYVYEKDVAVMNTANRRVYLTNNSFEETITIPYENVIGENNESTKESANRITQYLREWGKIPEFLEVNLSDKKGYGVFAKLGIKKNVFLGFYQGVYRPFFKNIRNKYLFTTVDFDGNNIGNVDAENMYFSNWARFMNDSLDSTKLNVQFLQYNYQIFVFSIRDIKQGEELLASYGTGYWESGQNGAKLS